MKGRNLRSELYDNIVANSAFKLEVNYEFHTIINWCNCPVYSLQNSQKND